MGFNKPSCNTIDCLATQIDIGSYISFVNQCCEIELTNGAHCHRPAVGSFTANSGLRTINMCQLCVCQMMVKQLKRMEDRGQDWQCTLTIMGEKGFLNLLLEEIGQNDSPLLRPDNEI